MVTWRTTFRPGGKWEVDTARLVKNFFEKLPFLRDQGSTQRKKQARKLFDDFLKKHKGTKVAERMARDAKDPSSGTGGS